MIIGSSNGADKSVHRVVVCSVESTTISSFLIGKCVCASWLLCLRRLVRVLSIGNTGDEFSRWHT